MTCVHKAQKTLDNLIDKGYIRSSDVDSRTMDALEGDVMVLPVLGKLHVAPFCLHSMWRDTHDEHMALVTADLGNEAANNAVSRFAEANFDRITNKAGFLMVSPRVLLSS